MDFLTKFKLNASTMVLLRYGTAIAGTIAVTAGLLTQDQVNTVTDNVATIANGVQIVGGAVAAITPVVIAVWKQWFKPSLPVKQMSPEVKKAAIEDVKANVQARKKRTTIFGF